MELVIVQMQTSHFLATLLPLQTQLLTLAPRFFQEFHALLLRFPRNRAAHMTHVCHVWQRFPGNQDRIVTGAHHKDVVASQKHVLQEITTSDYLHYASSLAVRHLLVKTAVEEGHVFGHVTIYILVRSVDSLINREGMTGIVSAEVSRS